MKLKEIFRKFFKFFNPTPDIGGLEISDSAIRYLTFSGVRLKRTVINLPPGTVADGPVKNRSRLIEPLKNLHRQITGSDKKTINIIATAFSVNVYSQVFNVPLIIDDKKQAEAVRLNLEMISPFDIKNAYYDAQHLNEAPPGQAGFLGVFTNAEIVDQFTIALESANFNAVAFEFPALSLSRLIKQLSEVDFYGSHIFLDVSGEGLNFLILVKGDLYFNHFISWQSIQEVGREATISDIETIIIREFKRLVSFYGNRIGRPLDTIVLLFPRPLPDLQKAVEESFPIKVQVPILDSFPELSAGWFPVLGAALRGLMPRSQDRLISLAAVGTEDKYFKSRITYFVGTWRNIILTSLAFILLIFLSADAFLMRIGRLAERELLGKLAQSEVQEVDRLQKEAQEFNRLVGLASSLKQKSAAWSPVLEQLNKLAANITLDRIFIDINKRVILNGRAQSEAAAIAFKNKLLQEKNFDKVILPLSSFRPNPESLISFTVNFEIKSF